MGSASAGEKFTLLKNIPAQALSQSEMAAVEGKLLTLFDAPFDPRYSQSLQAFLGIRDPRILPYAVYQYQLSSRTAPYWVAQALNPWGAAPYFSGISPYGYSVCQGVIGVRC